MAVFVLIRRAFIQQRLLPPASDPEPLDPSASIEVIIPARDEAANIELCLESLLVQTYDGPLHITVVDDGSTDETPEIVTRLARENAKLALMTAPPLTPGWTGKCQACWLAALAVGEPDWLCFIDADMRAEPALIAVALASAEAAAAALLSLAARQQLVTFAERLMIPCGLYVLAFQQDLAARQDAGGGDVTVSGQFMLVRREAYMAVGGHAAVRDRICEDLALASLLKRSGARVLLEDGTRIIATRMYDGWGSLWPGVAKNIVEMLGGPGATLASAAVALGLSWALVALPIWDAVAWGSGSPWAGAGLVLASGSLAAALGLHVAGSIHFRIPFWYGLTFPLAYTVGAVMALDSVRRRLFGGVQWKGRTYP